jgi:hypothetical protein
MSKKITREEAAAMPPGQLSDAILAGMPPFTITFKTPKEAAFLFNAAMSHLFGDRSDKASDLLGQAVAELGMDEGIKQWVEKFREHGLPVPDWFGPLCMHIKNSAAPNIQVP